MKAQELKDKTPDQLKEQLLALSAKYNAGYAVLPKDSKAEFEAVYRNKDYRVVKLR
mgnify:CR=1 FL=1